MSKMTLSCRHEVDSMDEAITLEMAEPNGKSYGVYCKPCADRLIAECGARRYEYPPDWASSTGCKPDNFTGEVPEDTMELVELIRAIRNRCDIFLALYPVGGTSHAWPTLLEDLGEDAMDILETYCIDDN